MWKPSRIIRSAYVLAPAAFLVPALVSDSGVRAEEAGEAFQLEDIYVVGSRRPVRSVADAPAPIDTIGGVDFTDQGNTNVPNLMRTLVPSYNVNTQPISDSATFVRPANLRGLAPDQTLVFVNGKRRHRAAVITWLGNGVSEGAQGPDISVIPAVALERVEVLRDTASAQYGSDAIAGVINFVLKSRPDGGIVETQWGRTYEGDGAEYRIASNVGLPIGAGGFANLSAQWHEAEPTVRSVQRTDAAALIANGNTHVRQPYAQIWGAPDVSGDFTVFLNSGVELGERAEGYAFGNIAGRETEGGFFFRNPNTRSGVFAQREPNTHRLVGDLSPDDGVTCPTIVMSAARDQFFRPEDAAAYMASNPGCFVFNERFPGGFTPQFKGKVSDSAATAGVRGSLDSGLTWDVSYTRGQSEIVFSMRDTVNASLGPDTPTQFELGSYIQTEQTANLDVTRALEIPSFASPLYAAAGLEWREEAFEIVAGERDSWIDGPLGNQGFGVGANGFSGFSEDVAGEWARSNAAGYVELETDVTADLTLATMGRVERFEDFGTTSDFKVATLFRATDSLLLRGSASTGFRVPTVGQQNVSNVTTAFVQRDDGSYQLTQRGTIPSTCPEAVFFGARPLDPEESVTVTAGVAVESGPLSLTADVYNIDVDGRLGLSEDRTVTAVEKAQIGPGGCAPAGDVFTFRYFSNGFDTRTRGIDLVASVDIPTAGSVLEGGETEFVFVGNWNRTEVVRYDPVFIDAKRISQLEDALPKFRFNATLRHERERWAAFARVNYFGAYDEWHADTWLIEPGSEITLDAEVSYRSKMGVEFSLGAENLLNAFPDENPVAGNVGAKYPESSPMGFAGGFYYGRARWVF